MFACSVFFFIVVCLFCILYFISIFLLLLPTWRIKLMMMINPRYLQQNETSASDLLMPTVTSSSVRSSVPAKACCHKLDSLVRSV